MNLNQKKQQRKPKKDKLKLRTRQKKIKLNYQKNRKKNRRKWIAMFFKLRSLKKNMMLKKILEIKKRRNHMLKLKK